MFKNEKEEKSERNAGMESQYTKEKFNYRGKFN